MDNVCTTTKNAVCEIHQAKSNLRTQSLLDETKAINAQFFLPHLLEELHCAKRRCGSQCAIMMSPRNRITVSTVTNPTRHSQNSPCILKQSMATQILTLHALRCGEIQIFVRPSSTVKQPTARALWQETRLLHIWQGQQAIRHTTRFALWRTHILARSNSTG